MATPSQDSIVCKGCGADGRPHKSRRLFCDPCGRRLAVEATTRHKNKLRAIPKEVICKGCGQTFSTEKAGRSWRCQECTRVYLLERRQADQYRHNVYAKQYRNRLGDAYRDKMRQRYHDRLAEMTPEQKAEFLMQMAEKARLRSANVRSLVFEAYGGARCVCCGESQTAFLSVDHIYNDGGNMRKSSAHPTSSTAFYSWLKRNNFPPGFQILCMNCNTGKHRNGGVCPHQSSKA